MTIRRQTNYIPKWPSTCPAITKITLVLKVEVKFWKGGFEEMRDLTNDIYFHIGFVEDEYFLRPLITLPIF